MLQILIDALEDKTTYGFSEFRLSDSFAPIFEQNEKLLNTVQLFSFGTYNDYITHKDDFIELSNMALFKLKQLTLISETLLDNVVSYDVLLDKLHLASVGELERLVFESVYAKLIKGTLYSKQRCLVVSSCMGRDVLLRSESVPKYGSVTTVENLLDGLKAFEERINRAFDYIEEINDHLRKPEDTENEESSHEIELAQGASTSTSDGRRHSSAGLLLVPNQSSVSMPQVSEINVGSSNGRKRKTQG